MSYHDWYVGMRIVCISQPVDKGWGHEMPVVGRVYTIRTIGESLGGDIVVRLVEVVNRERSYPSKKHRRILSGEICFAASNFRPIQTRKTDISIFTAMLTGDKWKVDA